MDGSNTVVVEEYDKSLKIQKDFDKKVVLCPEYDEEFTGTTSIEQYHHR